MVQAKQPQTRNTTPYNPLMLLFASPAGVNAPVLGSYNSVVDSIASLLFNPPMISTLPLSKSSAWWPERCVVMAPVGENRSVTGSYNSALANTVLSPFIPPVISTIPFGRMVAVWPARAVIIQLAGALTAIDVAVLLADQVIKSAIIKQKKVDSMMIRFMVWNITLQNSI